MVSFDKQYGFITFFHFTVYRSFEIGIHLYQTQVKNVVYSGKVPIKEKQEQLFLCLPVLLQGFC